MDVATNFLHAQLIRTSGQHNTLEGSMVSLK